MSSRKISRLLATGCFLACLVCTARAADGLFGGSSSDFLPLHATLQNEAAFGTYQIRRVYVKSGTNTFAFYAPDSFRLETSNPTKIILVQSELKCFLAIRVIASVPGTDFNNDFYRDQILREYPGAKISSGFAQPAGRHDGLAFDIQWVNPGRVVQSARVVFISSNVGVLELILFCQSENFADSKRFLDYLQNSYCSDQEGPIKPVQAPKEPGTS